MTWFAYECSAMNCPRGPTGLVLDVRVDAETLAQLGMEHPNVRCPLCGEPMHYRACWEATEGGYGSRGDGPPNIHPEGV